MTLLEDNHPGAQYNYLIGVQTGHRKNAGTTANVRVFSHRRQYGLFLSDVSDGGFKKLVMLLLMVGEPHCMFKPVYNQLCRPHSASEPCVGWAFLQVTVKVIGSEGDSGTHNLTDPEKPVFQRGAFDIFLLATPFPLGEVRNLRLQHDDSGGHPSWYWR